MKITILDDYQFVIEKLKCFEILKNQNVQILHHTEKDVEKLAATISDAAVLVLTRERTAITDELLDKLPNLKLISQTGKISNHLDLAACTKHAVAVAEGVGSPIAPAELTWALLMNTVRKIPQAIEGMKNSKWQINIGSTINGKTIGIWGYGKIGQRIAQYAKAFGADVLVWGSDNSRQKAVEDGFKQAHSKEEFFKTADVITLHLRLTNETFGIVKEEDLTLMKDNSVLINTARAELIEKGSLEKVLASGQNISLGVDVYEEEPIYDKNFELLKYDNVVCTPHLGYVEQNGYELYFSKAFENVINFINGKPTNIANPEVINNK
ncbi:MAG: D-2-hydroxyacid dehydrogenase family protein [Flavobacteriaceae bacterium]|jgi:D-3-phosphoglycerate dehydrogenase|uniref:D-2-hydroxyacid dehydrogenase family protein n=1 Tax=Elizabethkingia ursingii TaxID=1756150 RepID=UPI0020139F8A|nr:D-2-hydroxyacid dehydrogenase family protein [Elizabethkingia ursingii]MCL1662939.1 D-2-hydroxyacid dehydrogenase family protein [Elizabethkingia ursingii]MDR2229640.1 D-2-hydroxyacid dehydrogenase family protein [Flavobacteriaceae bacterium]